MTFQKYCHRYLRNAAAMGVSSRGPGAVNNVHSTFSVLNNTYSVDEVQQVEYLPTQFDYKMF